LYGWHYGVPVFGAAALKGDKEENVITEINGAQMLQQGSLLIVPENDQYVPALTDWIPVYRHVNSGNIYWFFNHFLVAPEAEAVVKESGERVFEVANHVKAVAVVWKGHVYACTRITGPSLVYSRDHDVQVVPEGKFFALHPFPATRDRD
jgi:hypothetical protein